MTKLAEIPKPTVVGLPANYERIYKKAVDELGVHLAGSGGMVARNAIRALVERVIVNLGNSRGEKQYAMQLQRNFFRMIAFAQAASKGSSKD